MTGCSPFIRRGARRAIDVKWGGKVGLLRDILNEDWNDEEIFNNLIRQGIDYQRD